MTTLTGNAKRSEAALRNALDTWAARRSCIHCGKPCPNVPYCEECGAENQAFDEVYHDDLEDLYTDWGSAITGEQAKKYTLADYQQNCREGNHLDITPHCGYCGRRNF